MSVLIRAAKTSDVKKIRAIVDTYSVQRKLLSKETVTLFESVQEFSVAEVDGESLAAGGAISAGRQHGDAVRGGRLVVQQGAVGHGDHARAGMDGEPPASAVAERIGDGVGRAVCVRGIGGNANHRAVGCVLGHGVGRRVDIGDCAHVKFIDITQVDGECLAAGGPIGTGGQHGDAVRTG